MMGAPNFMIDNPYQASPNYAGTPVKSMSAKGSTKSSATGYLLIVK
jgi:hypothetical protein